MNVEQIQPGVIKVTGYDTSDFHLYKTFECGQCFRWNKNADGSYVGIANENALLIKSVKFEDGKKGYICATDIDTWNNYWVNYFSLDTDYNAELNVSGLDQFAYEAYEFGKGIRILRQDLWETIISFIISQRNNIPKIKSTIDKLCRKYGKEVTVLNGLYTLYTFPNVDDIIAAGLEGLQGLGLGYRDKYIYDAAIAIKSSRFNINDLQCDNNDTNRVIEKLQEFNGIGPKVANCIALFGLNKLDSFPIDIWMERIINTYYNGSIDISVYGKAAGLVQQYMFYYIRENS